MASPASSRSRPFLRRCWAGATHVLLPILLAVFLTTALHRRLYRSDVRAVASAQNSFGQIRLKLKLPLAHAGIPEPLISCGRVGNASLVYIRLLPGSRAKIGIEFWGHDLLQGPEFALAAPDAEIDVACDLPAFYPEEGSSAWAGLPADQQKIRRSQYLITVNGVVRLQGTIDYPQFPHPPLYFGVNPLGGSFVSSQFTGYLLQVSQAGRDRMASGKSK